MTFGKLALRTKVKKIKKLSCLIMKKLTSNLNETKILISYSNLVPIWKFIVKIKVASEN